MTPPVELVLRSVEVSDAMARFVVVALVERRLGNVLVPVVVAVKLAPTTSPTTESFAYGEVVPMPRLPPEVRRTLSKSDPVCDFVENARSAAGEVVEIAGRRRFVAFDGQQLFQLVEVFRFHITLDSLTGRLATAAAHRTNANEPCPCYIP